MENKSRSIFAFLWRRRWLLMISSLIGAIVAYTATLFMQPKYESSVTLYAANTNSAAKIINDQEFGWDVDSDRLIQVLKSNRIRDSIVKKFSLVQYYKIDTNLRDWHHRLNERYRGNVDFNRTVYMSVKIVVRDKDPGLAARIANELAQLADKVRADIVKKNVYRAMKARKENYYEKLAHVNKLTDSLIRFKALNAGRGVEKLQSKFRLKQKIVKDLRNKIQNIREKYEVHNFNQQVDLYRELLTRARAKHYREKGKLRLYRKRLPKTDSLRIITRGNVEGTKEEIERLESQLNKMVTMSQTFNSYQEELKFQTLMMRQYQKRIKNIIASYEPGVHHVLRERLENRYRSELETLTRLKNKYEDALQRYEAPVPESYLISKAEPSYNKVAPLTWLYVLLGAVLLPLLVASVMLIQNGIREMTVS